MVAPYRLMLATGVALAGFYLWAESNVEVPPDLVGARPARFAIESVKPERPDMLTVAAAVESVNLWGVPAPSPQQSAPSEPLPPERWVRIAHVVSRDARFVVLRSPAGASEVFAEKSPLPDGSRLQRVARDSITVKLPEGGTKVFKVYVQ